VCEVTHYTRKGEELFSAFDNLVDDQLIKIEGPRKFFYLLKCGLHLMLI